MTSIPTRLAVVVLGAVAPLACEPPDDVLFTRQAFEPQEIRPGLFRVTWNTGPDVVRGFTPDGRRIVYRSRGLAAFGSDWRVLSVPVDSGDIREEAGIYRAVLRNPVGHIGMERQRRYLVIWNAALEGVETCGGCPPAPPAVELTVIVLEPEDGRPLSSLPTRNLLLPNNASTLPCDHRIRIRPADHELIERSVNPFGPASVEDSPVAYLSDGETVWRFEVERPSAAPESIGPGAFPALSPDGLLLAVAVPTITDSVTDICSRGLCCIQETVTITAPTWTIVLYDLAADSSWMLTSGSEPRFHPSGSRLLVSRFDGLHWIDLETGATESVPETGGAYAPAISPDGTMLAFSTSLHGNPDVFYVFID